MELRQELIYIGVSNYPGMSAGDGYDDRTVKIKELFRTDADLIC
jgi:hypothetical protein